MFDICKSVKESTWKLCKCSIFRKMCIQIRYSKYGLQSQQATEKPPNQKLQRNWIDLVFIFMHENEISLINCNKIVTSVFNLVISSQ